MAKSPSKVAAMNEKSDNSEKELQQKRYRQFMAFEGILLLFSVLVCCGLPFQNANIYVQLIIVALTMFHIVAIPICIFYLVGQPIVMTLSFNSPESRAFIRQLKERPVLSDEDFYARFYQGSAIPKNLVFRLRQCLADNVGPLLERVIPSDCLFLLEDTLDVCDVSDEVEREFSINFTRMELENLALDMTFENLVRLIQRRINLSDPGNKGATN